MICLYAMHIIKIAFRDHWWKINLNCRSVQNSFVRDKHKNKKKTEEQVQQERMEIYVNAFCMDKKFCRKVLLMLLGKWKILLVHFNYVALDDYFFIFSFLLFLLIKFFFLNFILKVKKPVNCQHQHFKHLP